MDVLGFTYVYEYYEENQGIKSELLTVDFDIWQFLPNSKWLSYLGALILGSSLVVNGAIADHTGTLAKPIKGAVVSTNSNCLNARLSPAGTVVTCLSDGTVLKDIVKEDNGWYELSSGNWVAKQYVTIPATAVATTTQQKRIASARISTLDLRYVKGNLMKGSEVRLLQTKLNYYKLLAKELDVDGVFGTKTMLAVKAYQEQKHLPIDGIVGDATGRALGM
ncbi:MAG: peptidoglycan-binding domain-containing protein [Limnothrix sp.]